MARSRRAPGYYWVRVMGSYQAAIAWFNGRGWCLSPLYAPYNATRIRVRKVLSERLQLMDAPGMKSFFVGR